MRGITLGLLIGIIIILTMGFTYEILNNYEEECYKHKIIKYNKTISYCDSNLRYAIFCMPPDPLCGCPEIKTRNITSYNYTDECVSWHLVRRTT